MDEKSILTINVVTPDGSVYENTTDLVICKTTVGEIGIMPNHLPLLASLAIDEVRVKVDDENFDEIAVSGGFVEFSDNNLSVVASAAERKETIDVSRAERAKQRAEKRIEEAKNENNDIDLRRAEVSLRRAINRLNISKH
ncbi:MULTISPECIES: F0F1 ATP synthase subunit epsilon [Ligilactobacillus]|uniref:ATP synthase epsilon chain n=1 Tax=Ligilactobacillus salivarius TaxID=1624 RepID=A0AAW7N536_9LACO|nr:MULTISPECIES: F0F1 ATP synthase subunit epsilon [Ligilactobacillus]AYC11471.1 ATP synthase epsilon chain [Ligilactobacillus salivarius]MBL1057575.1 F0F1 ATP synthase subunit epsilon [Ligilactobacillus salivarius]MCZ0744795.1 F0F1 ATP synthase subunit epsilon [Ligilactobacillus sp. UO.C109]MDD1402972.1 F0F1 ATP synthase subunit epsilon [Ligilactobacillus salivarius]MDM8262545.1 F0F1 ATP synthase subunit epsilon [Ligilactobacillus salivarius]